LSKFDEKLKVSDWCFGVRNTSSYYKRADGFSLKAPWLYNPAPPSNRQFRHRRPLSLQVSKN